MKMPFCLLNVYLVTSFGLLVKTAYMNVKYFFCSFSNLKLDSFREAHSNTNQENAKSLTLYL